MNSISPLRRFAAGAATPAAGPSPWEGHTG